MTAFRENQGRTPQGRVRGTVVTDLPQRLDRLPWSRFHWLVVLALGITWILDGLEVTIAGSIAGVLKESGTLRFTDSEIGDLGSAYILGAVLGAVFFGYLTDKLGRKKLFYITLAVYSLATFGNAFAWDFWSFALFRFLTGAGIGGEYAAINSAIQELIPARYRGRTDLAINGSFWVGAALGALGSIVLLAPGFLPGDLGWRLAFGIGGALAIIIIFLRGFLPESPRWLMIRGRMDEAEDIVAGIERRVQAGRTGPLPAPAGRPLRLNPGQDTSMPAILRVLFVRYRSRSVLGLSLMVAQAFFYNAIFFTYALILTKFYGVPATDVGWYILPFAVGNFLGPLILGPLFDTVGRKPMIAGTYAMSGILLAITGFLFQEGMLTATTQTLAWSVIFFFASSAASSAYLTVSESFPLETRATAIAIFYALGTLLGGVAAPWFFGRLIETGDPGQVVIGYLIAAGLMIGAALVELAIGIPAEGKPLEEVADPLGAIPRHAAAE
ncbi:MFS transporter [Azospirillum sp. SYSU D00513]|uniref:MFS transporter n=1 Tax=Azospirillum sp. SYSU D00513 TaxID=2812561 RepID=UPI001A958A65|nr:MFS transporter [Azospirillum sp. SYSU D00513]